MFWRARRASVQSVGRSWFDLQWLMHLDGATADELSRTATVAIGTDGAQVSAIGFYLVRALRVAAMGFVLVRWSGAQWQADAQQALALERIFVETVTRTNKTSS